MISNFQHHFFSNIPRRALFPNELKNHMNDRMASLSKPDIPQNSHAIICHIYNCVKTEVSIMPAKPTDIQ